jgi:hypothetical protein
MIRRLQLLTQETPEGSVFELTPGKAPEGRRRGRMTPPKITTPEGWICTNTYSANTL